MVKAQYGSHLSNFEEKWEEHLGSFKFSAMGMKTSGTVAVEPTQVSINGLVCTNSIAGTFPCGMNLSPNACAQSLGPANTPPLIIECPESIDLAP